MKFQKKPEIVEAIQWDGTKECEQKIKQMAGPGVFADWRKAYTPINVSTRNGQIRGEVGGWVTKDLLGILDYKTDKAMRLGYMPVDAMVIDNDFSEDEKSFIRQEMATGGVITRVPVPIEAMIGRIVDAKLAAMTQIDPIPDSPLDLTSDSFSDEVNDD